MESKLSEEIIKHSVGKDAVKMKRVRFPFSDDPKDLNVKPDFESGYNQEDLDLVPGRERSTNKRQLGFNEKMVDYVRSGTAVQLRIEQQFRNDVNYAEMSKD